MREMTENSVVVQKFQKSSRDNNFNVIRLTAAIFVFAGHMGLIRGGQAPLLGSYGLHELGVGILFLIGGYLITMSWVTDSNPLRYGIRRFLRLWPPFAIFILIMVFVAGPLLSDLGAEGYFESWYQTYLQNLRFFTIYAQPGVFTNLPIPNTTNGSLWTMPVEACLYLITPFVLTILRVKSHPKASFYGMAIITGAAVAFDIFLRVGFSGKTVVFYGTDLIAAFHLTVFYMIGMLFTYEEMKKYLNLQAGCVAMCFLFVFQFASGFMQYLMLYIIFPYFIFSLAFTSKPFFGKVGRKMEISYGIYLYGFFFQQLVVYFQQKQGLQLGYAETFLYSLLLTIAAATVSYFLVEMPMLKLSRFLIKKLNNKN